MAKKIGECVNIPCENHVYSSKIKIQGRTEVFNEIKSEINEAIRFGLEHRVESIFFKSIKVRKKIDSVTDEVDNLLNEWKKLKNEIYRGKNSKHNLKKIAKINLTKKAK